jgi:hypothetical protein
MCTSPIYVKKQGTVPCGQCLTCKAKKSRMWAIRIVHEAMSHGMDNTFVTLTYEDENLPLSSKTGNATLKKTDLQKFVKDLRNAGYRFRYYGAGEYGTEGERAKKYGGNPHYHILIFGQHFAQDKFGSNETLSNIWKKGNVFCGMVQWESASYVSKYIQKKLTGSFAQAYEIEDIQPEFSIMSRGSNSPKDKGTKWEKGIGFWYYENYIKDNLEVEDPKIPFHGKVITPPKYYMEKFWKQSEMHEAYRKAHNAFNQIRQLEENNALIKKVDKDPKLRYNVLRDIRRQQDINLKAQTQNKEMAKCSSL